MCRVLISLTVGSKYGLTGSRYGRRRRRVRVREHSWWVVRNENNGDRLLASIGAEVSFTDRTSGRKDTFILVAEAGQPAQGTMSVESPVGQALLGHGEGELLTVQTPSGEREFLITSVVAAHPIANDVH